MFNPLHATYKPIRAAWDTFVKTASHRGWLITNQSVQHFSQWMVPDVEKRAGSHMAYICGSLKVISESIVGFSPPHNLPSSNLCVSSKKFYNGGLAV
jgi:hypothetical protein